MVNILCVSIVFVVVSSVVLNYGNDESGWSDLNRCTTSFQSILSRPLPFDLRVGLGLGLDFLVADPFYL